MLASGSIIATALRGLRRAPRFSLAVMLTLGVGVGAGAALFGLVDILLLRPPSGVADAGRLRQMVLREYQPRFGAFTSASLAWVDYEAALRVRALEGAAAWITMSRSFGRGEAARTITVTGATPSFFTVLGVRPALGRFYAPDEDAVPTTSGPCVAGDRFWRATLGGGAAALGRELTVGGVTCTVVGVAPPGFTGLDLAAVDLWMPLKLFGPDFQGPDEGLWTTDRNHWIRVVGRLGRGVSDGAAADEATAAYRAFTTRRRDPDLQARADWVSVIPGRGASRPGGVNVAAMLFGGAIVLLLLIAANLVNLFLVRDLSRARETAIRVSLGSSTRRIFAVRATETGLLALGAGAVALVVAAWVGPVVRAALLRGPTVATPPLDMRVGAFATGLALLVGLLLAAASTMRLGRTDPSSLLRAAGTARSGGGRHGRSVRLTLVGVQAALSVALLVAATAFVTSLRRAAAISIGFDAEHTISATVPFDNVGLAVPAQVALYEDVAARVRRLPGVTDAALGYMVPWWNNRTETLAVPGRDTLPSVPNFGSPAFDAVTPEYLATMGMTMRAGRWFTEGDVVGAAPVLVVNEALAQLYWPGESALGHCIRVGADSLPCRNIVGVVANHRFTGDLEQPPVAAYFLPVAQAGAYEVPPKLFVRASGDPSRLLPDVQRILQTAMPGLPAASAMLLRDRLGRLLAPWRLGSLAFTALGALATLIAALGLFGVLAFVVAERRREFAIRAAIGATARQIARPVLWQGVATVGAGVGAGFLLAAIARRWLQPLLFHTTLGEPAILLFAAAVPLAIAALASLGPARSAAGQDPMQVLRSD